MFVECVNPCNVCENPGIFCTQDYECLSGCDCPQVQPSDFGDRNVIVAESSGRCDSRMCSSVVEEWVNVLAGAFVKVAGAAKQVPCNIISMMNYQE
ncbi:hypothetical protein CEXT_523311 [Caerostris extrusa]|uniref:TIL domain-containing protein n=1 Tax=Caerostris extrusa TaxID=172846 RepID=A0AAV4XWN3_CAEEX|nr:hypothetical protein CEXT_523311 [Caerostris extrusa]